MFFFFSNHGTITFTSFPHEQAVTTLLSMDLNHELLSLAATPSCLLLLSSSRSHHRWPPTTPSWTHHMNHHHGSLFPAESTTSMATKQAKRNDKGTMKENRGERRENATADIAGVANFDLRFRCTRTSVHSEVSTVGTLAASTTKPIFRIVVSPPSTAVAAAFGSSFRSTPATDGKTEDTATILAVRRAKPYLQFRIWVILFDDPDNHRQHSAELSGQTVDSLGKRTAPLSFWPRKDEGTTFLYVSGDSSSVNPVSRNFVWRLFADKFQKLDFRTMNGSTLHRSYTMGGIEPTYANKDVIGSELHLSMEIG